MYRYYLGIAIMCVVFAVFALLLASKPVLLAAIFTAFAGGFLAIAYITSGPESRW
ncbi:MAG TPA: hypothetical protein VFV52_06225 [Bacilli bacterium]|nr:hypothetical protein [Bacilli bacterium]